MLTLSGNFSFRVKSNVKLHLFFFRNVIGPDNSRHPLNKQDLKLQPIGIHIFPRLRNLIVYT